MIEKWKIALSKFLEEYEDNEDVIGALLTGNYAMNISDKNSNINVYIITKDSCSYQTRGVKKVNGFLIEFLIIPSWKIEKIFDVDFKNGNTLTANTICYAKIIFDLEDKIQNLQKSATNYIDKPLKSKTEYELELNNYQIWSLYNELKGHLDKDSNYFDSIYFELLNKILNSYYEYLQIPKLPRTKAYEILSDEKIREKYHIFKIPEKKFVNLYINCFINENKEEKYQNITELIKYFYEKIGGFDIDDFELATSLY